MKKTLTFSELRQEVHANIDTKMGKIRNAMIREMIADGQRELYLRLKK